jgi:hypothetical protein
MGVLVPAHFTSSHGSVPSISPNISPMQQARAASKYFRGFTRCGRYRVSVSTTACTINQQLLRQLSGLKHFRVSISEFTISCTLRSLTAFSNHNLPKLLPIHNIRTPWKLQKFKSGIIAFPRGSPHCMRYHPLGVPSGTCRGNDALRPRRCDPVVPMTKSLKIL